MTTVAEIEAAIEQLPQQQVEELASWLETHRAERTSLISYDAWLGKAKGAARPGATTLDVMELTRGEPKVTTSPTNAAYSCL